MECCLLVGGQPYSQGVNGLCQTCTNPLTQYGHGRTPTLRAKPVSGP